MQKNNEDSRGKHGKQNAKHLEAFVLREKWVEENAGKTKVDWTQEALKTMQKKYKVTWIVPKLFSYKDFWNPKTHNWASGDSGRFGKQNSERLKKMFGAENFN